jgi:DNA-binding transcriptional ArsR family regulator
MKPQFHPSDDDITIESILHALSDPAGVQIFAAIAQSECAQPCAAFLVELSDRNVPKSTLSQRFRTPREAGLIRSERPGVPCASLQCHLIVIVAPRTRKNIFTFPDATS